MRKSAEYAHFSEQLGDILETKANLWVGIREETKSDKQADKAWDATPDGIQEMRLRLRLKALEKEMSAISSHLRVLDTEARNLT